MTMEDRSGGVERAAPATSNSCTTEITADPSYPPQRTGKRSFDVAFLVAPDENLAKRQNAKMRLISSKFHEDPRREAYQDDYLECAVDSPERLPQNLTLKHFEGRRVVNGSENSSSPPYVSPRIPSGISPEPEPTSHPFLPTRLHKTPSPSRFTQQGLLTKYSDNLSGPVFVKGYDRHSETRSAFTKVNLSNNNNPRANSDDGQTSPRSSISPDDRGGYQQDSRSPPIAQLPGQSNYKYPVGFPGKMTYPFLVDSHQPAALMDNLKIPQIAQPPKAPSPKMPNFRGELPVTPVYAAAGNAVGLPYSPMTAVFPPMAEALTRPRFLATAASVAGLLPSSFAALALPAQNVCAKCNLSFRMTSDLVYHMRSHHKSESVSEIARRRREEKLRCPVCDESFRERHHLTRHMTAHQDKESDAIVDQAEMGKRRATAVHGK